MTGVQFWVDGVPVPQGSKRAFVVNGRAVLADVKSEQLKKWRRAVAENAQALLAETFDCALEVRVEFVTVRPVSVKREYPLVAPDVDKLARAVLDGLTQSGLIKDDARVVRLVAEKRYGSQPGARVSVRPLPGEGEVE